MCRTCNGVLPMDTDDPDRVCKCGTECWPDEAGETGEEAA